MTFLRLCACQCVVYMFAFASGQWSHYWLAERVTLTKSCPEGAMPLGPWLVKEFIEGSPSKHTSAAAFVMVCSAPNFQNQSLICKTPVCILVSSLLILLLMVVFSLKAPTCLKTFNKNIRCLEQFHLETTQPRWRVYVYVPVCQWHTLEQAVERGVNAQTTSTKRAERVSLAPCPVHGVKVIPRTAFPSAWGGIAVGRRHHEVSAVDDLSAYQGPDTPRPSGTDLWVLLVSLRIRIRFGIGKLVLVGRSRPVWRGSSGHCHFPIDLQVSEWTFSFIDSSPRLHGYGRT